MLFALGVLAIVLLGVLERMQKWLAPPLGALLGGKLTPLLYFTSVGSLLLFCAAGVWTLRRWLRCSLWQPGHVAQELLFVLFLLIFGGELLYMIYMVAEAAHPVWFEQRAGSGPPVRLLLLLLLGRAMVLPCLIWLWGVVLLVLCYAFAGKPMGQWCPFGRIARRTAAVAAGLLPLCGVAVLFDHVARMHWKFKELSDMYSGRPSTSVSEFMTALLVVYVIAVGCIVYTAGRVYQDRLLRCLAFLPALALLFLLGGFAGGVFFLVFR